MPDIKIKEYIRKYFSEQMTEAKFKYGLGVVPAIIIRDSEEERFVDELWNAITNQAYNDSQNEKN